MNRLDQFGRRHIGLTLLLTLALAILVTVILLSQSEAPAVLYQAF